ncbi:hypothetical protein KQX54_009732 [Cotesia glomerata]|uniref:Uncharacterized protein n=1 Tax=Cotesia glomerata TaxID=32391 RepID=A0AAV7ICQ0_COTGL|nr:hypothetical protein KQX54_009732 [Cotesia glomerata]
MLDSDQRKKAKSTFRATVILYPFSTSSRWIWDFICRVVALNYPGISVPILTGRRILSYSQNFQFQYPLPQNSTHYFSTLKRRRRSISGNDERRIFYQLVEQELQRWSGNGKACMLKSICEASSVPLNRETLVENLLHVVLTPDYGNNSTFADKDYTEAALVGRRRDDCALIYSHCPEGYGLLDSISRIHSYYF